MKNIGLRTVNTEKAYKDFRNAVENYDNFDLSTMAPIKSWSYWQLIKNDFPYDFIASKHDMLTPKRVFGSLHEATFEEREELENIKHEISEDYDYFMESSYAKTRSIKTHYHLHCVVLKENICENSSDRDQL